MHRRYLGRDGTHRHPRARVLHPVLACNTQQRRCERPPTEPSRIGPDTSRFADRDARSLGEERDREISGKRRAGRPARAPETDEAHDA
jgi:hypothetical protein